MVAESSGEGVGVFDLNLKQFQSMTWVLKGKFTMGPRGTPIDTASIIEWKQK